MSTPPLDLDKIMREHRNIGPHWAGRWVCAVGCESDGTDPCLPYQIAKLAQGQAAALADTWDDGANAAWDWIAAGAWLATMPMNPHRTAAAGEQS